MRYTYTIYQCMRCKLFNWNTPRKEKKKNYSIDTNDKKIKVYEMYRLIWFFFFSFFVRVSYLYTDGGQNNTNT